MSAESQPAPVSWPILNAEERRVLGVLVEKAKTTPDSYPMTVNALVTGSNQKSNRDPIMDLSDLDVEDTLVALQKRNLVLKITTAGRTIKWRHDLYASWHLDKVDIAILAELLLRGPQTEGELRTRASRMEDIQDLDALRAVLKPLVERKLVVYLTPEGKRGTVVTHGFHVAQELEKLRKKHNLEAVESEERSGEASRVGESTAPPPAFEEWKSRLDAAHGELERLNKEVVELRAALGTAQTTLNEFKDALGKLQSSVQEVRQGLGI